MGNLNIFNINNYIINYNITDFIETGTAKGHGLEYANTCNFKKLHSVEFSQELYDFCIEKFKSKENIEIIHGTSKSGLEQILSNEIEGNILFWLDAHYPYADVTPSIECYNMGDDELRLPLEMEMRLIHSKRRGLNDIIIVDDLRIYEDNNYECGNMPPLINPPKNRNIDFIYELYSETHTITKDLRNEGYLIIEPKSK
jgi:hypothetical protein